MTKRFYLDTCVWRDFYEGKFSRSGRPLGKHAAQLFMKIMKKRHKILFSESLIWELRKDYSIESINSMFSFLFASEVLVKVGITKEENMEARVLSSKRNLPFIDCLHAIQARNHKAIMISQDRHIIHDLSDIAKTLRPDEVN